jgi:hypothetical protein
LVTLGKRRMSTNAAYGNRLPWKMKFLKADRDRVPQELSTVLKRSAEVEVESWGSNFLEGALRGEICISES